MILTNSDNKSRQTPYQNYDKVTKVMCAKA